MVGYVGKFDRNLPFYKPRIRGILWNQSKAALQRN